MQDGVGADGDGGRTTKRSFCCVDTLLGNEKPCVLRVDRGGPWWTVPWTVRGPLFFHTWTVVDRSFKEKIINLNFFFHKTTVHV